VTTVLLLHRHDRPECPVAFAAWRGFQSPLRHKPALSTCPSGGHYIVWMVEAATAEEAMALLPPFVATRTDAMVVAEVPIP
jgi:hypothetical protein